MKLTHEIAMRFFFSMAAICGVIVLFCLCALFAINSELARRKVFKVANDAESIRFSGVTNCYASVDGCKTWHRVTFSGSNGWSDPLPFSVKKGQTVELRFEE